MKLGKYRPQYDYRAQSVVIDIISVLSLKETLEHIYQEAFSCIESFSCQIFDCFSNELCELFDKVKKFNIHLNQDTKETINKLFSIEELKNYKHQIELSLNGVVFEIKERIEEKQEEMVVILLEEPIEESKDTKKEENTDQIK